MNSIVKCLLVIAVLGASTYIRLANVTENGIRGSDTFQYWEIAIQWLRHHWVFNNEPQAEIQFFRPLFFALNWLSIKLFGLHDYSLKMLMGIFETINVGLVFSLGLCLLRCFYSALAVSIVYAFTPSAIFMASIELPHAYTTSAILAMFLFGALRLYRLENGNTRGDYLLLFLCGLSGGLSATLHGSTTFFAPGMLLALLLASGTISGARSRFWRNFRLTTIYFTIGFLTPYLLSMATFGVNRVVLALLSESKIRTTAPPNSIQLFWDYFRRAPEITISPISRTFFWTSLALILSRTLIKRARNWRDWLIPLVMGFTLLVFCFVFKNVFYPRLYTPMVPLTLIVIFLGLKIVCDALPKSVPRLGPTLALSLCLYLFHNVFLLNPSGTMTLFAGKEKGAQRSVFDQVGGAVNESRRLLVAPYIFYTRKRQFNATVYFGPNAVYLFDCRDGDLGRYIEESRIGYVFVGASAEWDPRVIDEGNSHLGACIGQDHRLKRYDPERDAKVVRHYLQSVGATKIPMDPAYGELYRLPEKTAAINS